MTEVEFAISLLCVFVFVPFVLTPICIIWFYIYLISNKIEERVSFPVLYRAVRLIYNKIYSLL